MGAKARQHARIVTSSDLVKLTQLVAALAVQRNMRLSEACHYVEALLDRAQDIKLYDAGYEGLPELLDPDDGEARSKALLSLFNSHWWEREDPLPENFNEWSLDERASEFLAIEQQDAAVLLGLSPEEWTALVRDFPHLHLHPRHDVSKRNASSIERNCLNRDNPHFSLKLAAAIEAWHAVSTHQESVRGKSVKQALMDWLRRNAAKFDLIKDDGTANEQGIEEVAKIANWDTKGGAPKTPGGKRP